MTHPDAAAYLAEARAALHGNPERASRLAELEAACGRAESAEEFRAASTRIGELLDEVFAELAPDWPQILPGVRPAPE